MDELPHRKFAKLLTEAIHRIRIRESKTVQAVQDELGYVLGKHGGASIEHWRKGHLPRKMPDIETLAREITRRGRMERAWIEEFLNCAGYPAAQDLCGELFAVTPPAPAAHERASGDVPSNLPVPSTPLIGREAEVALARQNLARPGTHLLTLVGPPGVGKTRLALQIASDMTTDFEAGCFFVSLASLTDPERVLPAVAQALGIAESGHPSLPLALSASLRSKHLLLVLDNVEQVLSAAPHLAALLDECAGLKILATSRVPLDIRAERQFLVSPLALPDSEQLLDPVRLAGCPAIALFIDRAQAVNPDFTMTAHNSATVAAICARLDGLPLAIELVAKQTRLLALPELLSMLDRRLLLVGNGPQDLPPRQRTIRSTIDWSYDLLEPGERDLLARMSVFVGGCTREAVAAVCRAGEPPRLAQAGPGPFDDLTSLVNKSLIFQRTSKDGSARYLMLNMIREYAQERLEGSGEAERLRHAHARYYVQLAEAAEAGLKGPHQAPWMQQLEAEYDNLRAAFNWAVACDSGELALRLGGALGFFWQVRGYMNEGRQWLELALARLPSGASISDAAPQVERCRAARAKALYSLGRLVTDQGDYALARACLAESLHLSRAVHDPARIAQALTQLGVVMAYQRDYARSQAYLDEGLAQYQALDDQRGVTTVLHGLMVLVNQQGNREQTLALLEKVHRLSCEMGNTFMEIRSLFNLASWHAGCGDYARARSLLQESLALNQQANDRLNTIIVTIEMGRLDFLEGDHAQAHRRYRQGLTAFVEIGHQPGAATTLLFLAELAEARGETAHAARLCGLIDGLQSNAGTNFLPMYRPVYERVTAATRAALDDAAFSRAWEEGWNSTRALGRDSAACRWTDALIDLVDSPSPQSR